MRRMVCGAIFVVGLLIGFGIAAWPFERVVAAQSGWQCRSWTLDEKGDATAVGTWLGAAQSAQIATAGLSAGSRFTVVACKK